MRAIDLAKYIINKAIEFEKPVSILPILKILYIVHREVLRQTGKKLITDEEFEAWQWGGVIREVYVNWSIFGSNKLIFYEDLDFIPPEDVKNFIDKTIYKCVNYRPWKLVQQAKIKNGAWDKTYKDGLGDKNYIPHKLIEEEANTYSVL